MKENSTTIQIDKFTYIQGDGINMHMFKDKELDLVISVGVFEHLVNMGNVKKWLQKLEEFESVTL